MKRIAIDARMIGPVPHGIARYVSGFARGLSRKSQNAGGLPYEPIFIVSQQVQMEGFSTVAAASPFLALGELTEIPRILKKINADYYHSPSFSSLIYAPCPWMATIHDLNHLRYGSIEKKLYYKTLLKRFSRLAIPLMTVSEFSRHELSRWTGIDSNSIEVVYNSIDPSLWKPLESSEIDSLLQEFGLKRGRYFLSMTSWKPHKNLALLLEAFGVYRVSFRGAEAWDLAVSVNGQEQIENTHGVKLLGGVTDRLGRALLQGCGAAIFPSSYEGFGLPPVEAAAVGVPLIVSKIPPHEEGLRDLARDEVEWVAPHDSGGWTAAMRSVSEGKLHPPSMNSCASIRARFSEERLAEDMDRIYRRVLRL